MGAAAVSASWPERGAEGYAKLETGDYRGASAIGEKLATDLPDNPREATMRRAIAIIETQPMVDRGRAAALQQRISLIPRASQIAA